MRRAPILTTALFAAAGAVLSAGVASAQTAGAPTGEARGLRYMTWPGRGEIAPAAPAAALPAPAAPARRDLRRPNPVIPHGGFAAASPPPATRPGLTPAPGAGRTLTPANAWMNRAAPPPEPVAPAPTPPPPPAAVATPDYLPDPGRGQAVPAELIRTPAAPAPAASPPAPARTDPYDPMAPRRDAPIFRMQQDAPAAAPTPATVIQPAAAASDERSAQSGGRYYSVHRQNGRRPDQLEMPEPTYIDALAVTMPETIASQDLAAPEQGPTFIRDAQGRVRPAPAASDGDHQ